MHLLGIKARIALILGTVAVTAQATDQAFTVEGIITEIQSPDDPFQIGRSFELTVTYDNEIADDLLPDTPRQGDYQPNLSFVFNYDSGAYVGTGGSEVSWISIYDGPDRDFFQATVSGPLAGFPDVNGNRLMQAWLTLSDSSSAVFSDDSLPLEIDPSQFDSGTFSLAFGPGYHISGSVVQVPEPSTFGLLLLGSLLFGAIASGNARRGRRSNGLPRPRTRRRVRVECLAKQIQENVSASIICSGH